MTITVNSGDICLQYDSSSARANKSSEQHLNSCFAAENDFNSEVIDSCDERIEKNKKTIKEKKNLWSWAKNAIKDAKNAMHSILRSYGVSNYRKINDASKQKEYLSHLNNKNDYRMVQIGASSAILRASIDTCSACSTKMNAVNAQAIGKLLAG